MITANTADEGTFISNGVYISSGAATNPKLILNGVNIFKGDINISDKDFTILFNANQGSVGELTMGSVNLNLSLDASVSEVILLIIHLQIGVTERLLSVVLRIMLYVSVQALVE